MSDFGLVTTPAHRVVAARAGRVVFGAVLILGMVRLVVDSFRPGPLHAVSWFGLVWPVAFGAGALAWGLVRICPLDVHRDRFAASGLVVPAIGVALMLPLTLHLLVALALIGVRWFDDWVLLSFIATGLPHLVLATLSGMRALAFARGEEPFGIGLIFGLVMLATLPAFVIVLPPFVVALTFAVLSPILSVPGWIARRERALLVGVPRRSHA